MTKRNIETHTTTWRGIAIEIRFERKWLNSDTFPMAHLQVSCEPRMPLLITKTGCISRFTSAELIDDYGGPIAFVAEWLDHGAKSPGWEASQQLSLF